MMLDYMRLNKVTVFDAEPLPNIEALLADIAQNPNHVLSKIDLSKGYWQVPDRIQPFRHMQVTSNG